MTIIEGFFEEVGFFESRCTGFEWTQDQLELFFESGIDIGGSLHPLADSFSFGPPCRVIYQGVTYSELRISKLVAQPNIFSDQIIENTLQPEVPRDGCDFYMEGSMMLEELKGWFVWNLSAQKFFFDDLMKC